MAKVRSIPEPPSPDARAHVLAVIRQLDEPVTAAVLSKRLHAPHQLKPALLTPILEDFVAQGALLRFAATTAKAAPKYWDRDPRSLGREFALAAIQRAPWPVTAKDLAGQISPTLKMSSVVLDEILQECSRSGLVHRIPAVTKAGKSRYWHSDVVEFGRRIVLEVLQTGPQTEIKLKSALKGFAVGQLTEIYSGLLNQQKIFRYPPAGKTGKNSYGIRPPSPEPYFNTIALELHKIVERLREAHVPMDDLRRAIVQMAENAGISFGGSPQRQSSLTDSVDLLGLIRQIEPGADRGSLVGARDLRRAAQLSKSEFDHTILRLAREGSLSLHRHDYPASLAPADLAELVTDGQGNYYVGVALRRNSG